MLDYEQSLVFLRGSRVGVHASARERAEKKKGDSNRLMKRDAVYDNTWCALFDYRLIARIRNTCVEANRPWHRIVDTAHIYLLQNILQWSKIHRITTNNIHGYISVSVITCLWNDYRCQGCKIWCHVLHTVTFKKRVYVC